MSFRWASLCDRIKRLELVSEIDGCGCFAGSGKTATKEDRRQTRVLPENWKITTKVCILRAIGSGFEQGTPLAQRTTYCRMRAKAARYFDPPRVFCFVANSD